MTGYELHNKLWDEINEDVRTIFTVYINELRQQQDVCDVQEDIERFTRDLRMLDALIEFNKNHPVEFRTMRCVEDGFEQKEVLCTCGHRFGAMFLGKFFDGERTNCCPDCGRSIDWSAVFGE